MANSAFSVTGTSTTTGAMSLISMQTASGSSNISFTNLTNSYAYYKIVITGVTAQTNNSQLYLLFSTDNGSTYLGGTNYTYAAAQGQGGLAPGPNAFGAAITGVAQIQLWKEVSNIATHIVSGEINLYNPDDGVVPASITSLLAGFYSSGTWTEVVAGSGNALFTTAVNAIRFQMNSGNIATGNFYLYGILA